MSEREQLIAMMAATLLAGGYGTRKENAVDEAEAILAEIDARAAARREPPETAEQRRARNDATAERVVAQLNAQQHNAPMNARKLTLAEVTPQMRVAYVPTHAEWDTSAIEHGTVSSKNERYVFVKFDKLVAKFGWDGTTSQSCKADDLVAI